ncbi:MAG: glycine dehydrogenase, partial [Pseudonocardiales bacterium]|nr:glycine dehydrogenase [Pseudonocardiales bacterium]
MTPPDTQPATTTTTATPTATTAARRTLAELERGIPFVDRHIGPDDTELARMAEVIGVGSLDELADRALPAGIRTALDQPTTLPAPATESESLAELRALAARNRLTVPMIGLGYHGTITPPVIRRSVLENPAWYTAYTPYQPEISQGRLEALLNFQTVVSDLTGLPVAGASVLDEATAAAEAMTLIRRAARPRSARFVVDADTLPRTLAVLRTRAEPLGIEIVEADLGDGLPDGEFYGLLLSYPGASGAVVDHAAVIGEAHE